MTEGNIVRRRILPGELREDLPPRFWHVPPELPHRQPDNIFGVAQETDVNRNFWVEEIKKTIMEGGQISVVVADVDGLKRLNDGFSRTTGDLGIKHMGCIVAQEIDKFFPLSEKPLIRFFRVSNQADEVCFIIHSAKDLPIQERLQGLKESLRNYPAAKKGVLVDREGEEIEEVAELSFSVGIASTEESGHASLAQETLALLRQGKIERPYDLLNFLRRGAEKEADQIKKEKMLREIERLKQEDEQTPVMAVIEQALDRFSSLRLGREAGSELLTEVAKRRENEVLRAVEATLKELGLDGEKFMGILREKLGKAEE
jgi:GGDEF domain-containing protein